MKRSLRLHNYLKTFLFLAIFGFNAQVSFGQQLLQWNTVSNSGTETTEPSIANDPNVAPANLTQGSITPGSNGNRFGGSNWFNTGNTSGGNTLAEAVAGNDYIQFVVTPNAGFSFTPTSFVFKWDRSSTGPSNATLRSSADGFTSDLGSVTSMVSGGTATTTDRTITITGLNNISVPTTFRLYGYGASATTGTGGLDCATGATAPNVVLNGTTAVLWDGTSWSNTSGPTSSINAVIDGIYNTNAGGTQIGFTAKKLTVTTNGNLTINSGTNITVQDDVINSGSLTVESNANLVQVNNITNSGNISVKRDTNPLMRFDYVMWSTPVDGTQKLLDFSPLTSLTPAVRFYTYDNVNNVYVSVPDPASTEFVNATGYLIRLPFDHPTAPAVWTGTFSGVPNNGPVSLTSLTPGQFYATGNPYPSTISADLFMNANGLTDALYFWRKTNGAAGSAYATYTLAGGTSPAPGTTATATSGIPNGTIQVGQGFIAKANGTSLVYNNLMRATPNNDNQTFRSASEALPTTVEKNRFWLNLANGTETIGQTLVSYMTGATNGLDAQIDGKYINDSATALTSLIAGEEFAIQGKTLPFTASDVVPLGFKAQTAGNYSISLFDKDGLFSSNGQIIYLRDNLTNTVQNLNSGAYNFTSQAGVFNGRFDVVYQNALNTDVVDFTSNNVYIYNQNNVLNINSGTNTMSAVKVYDVLGRLLAQSNKVNASQTQINVPATNQTLIVQITSSEGIVVVKKVAN
jgi:hypothetical protein